MSRPPEFRVISIGALAAHPLWGEQVEVRSGHATTTLVTAGEFRLLVDPSLPAPALVARLGERSGLRPDQVTHVFMTSADFLHRRALEAFPEADWLAHEPALAHATAATLAQLQEAETGEDPELVRAFEHEVTVLKRVAPAPDRLAPGVDLFPLPGVSPGNCGLLLPLPRATVCICGDAVATVEHLREGKVLPGCHDIEQAQESFAEVVEIADILVLGRDNVTANPLRG